MGSFDVVIIGGGPGGYVAAIRAAQLGMSVAVVECRDRLGGTCLNVGCIPSKALLQSSHLYAEADKDFAAHGIKTTGLAVDLKTMLARKDTVVEELTSGVEFLFKKNKITHVKGKGSIIKSGEVLVSPNDGGAQQVLTTSRIIIATGSEVTPLSGVEIDEKRIVSSTGGLFLSKVPKHLVVIGGGFIGLELGSVWMRLGAQVTVVEFLDHITPSMDDEVSKHLMRSLKKQGMKFKMLSKVRGAKVSKTGVSLTIEAAVGDKSETLKADVVLVSIGRIPYTKDLGLEALGVIMDKRGIVQVNHTYATNVPGIYAIGDCIPGPMLAHKASEDGVACVEMMAGNHAEVDYNTVPGVAYTWPEAASVGATEQALKADGVDYVVGKFPFTANPRAKSNAFTEGFVKILAHKTTDRVLGVHILGAEAGTLIHEAVLAMEFGGSAEDIARTCHAHPTLAEAMKEAALDVAGQGIHI
jgi:dihydrolipoamide dehydrogenase